MPGNMMNQAKLDASQVSFSTTFNTALNAIDDPLRALSMEIPSSTKVEEHDWMDAVPGLSEWLDDRKLSNLNPQSIRIVNKSWASGIRINRDDVLDDRLGIITPRLQQLASKAGLHYGKLMLEALIAGFVVDGDYGNAYDGAAFFSAAHQDHEDGPVQSNTGAATPLAKAAYFAARAQMFELKDSEGDSLGIVPDTLICGPSNEETAYAITQAEFSQESGASINNAARGTARTIISPSLSGAHANKWFLASLNQPVKPLILQIREAITSSFEDATFMNKKLKYGAEARHNVGFALWQHIYGNTGV